ncbi:MAG: SUMF1/EgtB/PvdO family nonheme iron enzyme [Anaerolineales bacterium]|nr:SUMF1/EgtB/PvdO family nonheme iron enzyme [Anaerolineales bacterium]
MKKYFTLSFILLFIAACQATPTAAPTLPAAETPQATVTTAPTEILPPPTVAATATSAPETIKISANDGMTQLFVPAGTFFMGGMDVYRESDELPAREVKLDAFWIDQVEVTNGMYNLCVQAGTCRPPAKLSSDNRDVYFGNPEFQDYPVVHVAWYDANAYCQWAGRRLPTEAEWERAARGDDKRNFPWGDEPPNQFNSNSINLVGDTTRVGSYAEGASPFGALDMAGNVWEWVADRYRPDYYGKAPSENPTGPADNEVFSTLRVIRGGSFQDDWVILRLANRSFLEGPNPSAQPTDGAYYGKSSAKIGFRCADDN